ncbi:hypothetical protein GCM10010836_05330 [Aminobacter aminovorans]
MALAEITGYPLPDEILGSFGALRPDRQISEPAERVKRQAPLKASDVDEPIDGQRAIEGALRRIVGLTDLDVKGLMSMIKAARAKNGVPLSPDQPHDQHESTIPRHVVEPSK